jgi:hypothetical protein
MAWIIKQNWLRFPYDSIRLRSRDLQPPRTRNNNRWACTRTSPAATSRRSRWRTACPSPSCRAVCSPRAFRSARSARPRRCAVRCVSCALRSVVLAGISLCDVCSCHEINIEGATDAGGRAGRPARCAPPRSCCCGSWSRRWLVASAQMVCLARRRRQPRPRRRSRRRRWAAVQTAAAAAAAECTRMPRMLRAQQAGWCGWGGWRSEAAIRWCTLCRRRRRLGLAPPTPSPSMAPQAVTHRHHHTSARARGRREETNSAVELADGYTHPR